MLILSEICKDSMTNLNDAINNSDTKSNLDLNQILIAEFEYAKETSTQSNEDRTKVYNLLIANALTIIAAVALPDSKIQQSNLIFLTLFSGLFIFGLISLVQLARIRTAWIDSVRSMNQIKDFYINEHPELEKAFRWRMHTIPSANKRWTVAFTTAINVSLINSVSFGAALYFFTLNTDVILLSVAAIVALILQLFLWLRLLTT
jgi:hypothetical protein